MAVRMHLLFSCVALFILVLNNVNTFRLNRPVEKKISQYGNSSWLDCGGATEPARIHTFAVLPDPIKLPGNLSISTTFTLTSALPNDVSLAVVMEKKVAGFWVKVPCIDEFGSCTFPSMCDQWTKICPKLNGNGNIPCTCPIPPGDYTGTNVIITLNPPVVVSGDYRLTGKFISATAGEISCVQFNMTTA